MQPTSASLLLCLKQLGCMRSLCIACQCACVHIVYAAEHLGACVTRSGTVRRQAQQLFWNRAGLGVQIGLLYRVLGSEGSVCMCCLPGLLSGASNFWWLTQAPPGDVSVVLLILPA